MRLLQFLSMMWKGVVGIFIQTSAAANPEIAYAGIVQQRLEDRQKLMTAVAHVHAEMKRVKEERQQTERDLEKTKRELASAVKIGNKQAGSLLLQKQKRLAEQLESLVPQDERLSKETARLLAEVERFNRQIKELQEEARLKTAQLRSARATNRVLDTIDGLSIRGDDQALEAIRTAVRAEISGAEIRQELAGRDVDRQLAEVESAAAQDTAEDEFDRLRATFEQQQGVSAAATPSSDGGGKTA